MRACATRAVVVALLAWGGLSAQASANARLVVIAASGGVSNRHQAAIVRRVEGALAPVVELVPSKDFTQHARSLGFSSEEIATRVAADAVGPSVNATHVLLLNWLGKRRRGKRAHAKLDVKLVAVQSGTMMRIGRYRLKKGTLGSSDSASMADRVLQKIEVTPPTSEKEPEVEFALEAATDPEVAVTDPFEKSVDGIGPWARAAKEPASDTKVTRELTLDELHRRRTGRAFRLELGALLFDRAGELSAKGLDRTYDTDGKLYGVVVDIELFPWAFERKHTFLTAFGAWVRGRASRVTSTRAGGVPEIGTAWALSAGLAYRFSLWSSPAAPRIAGEVGYHATAFPGDPTVFPGLAAHGPRLGVSMVAPIGHWLAITGGGGISGPLAIAGDAAKLGDASLATTRAFDARAGVRLRITVVELGIGVGYEHVSIGFDGAPTLDSMAGVKDISFTESTLCGRATVGLAF